MPTLTKRIGIEAIIWPLRGVLGHSKRVYLAYCGNAYPDRLEDA